MTKLYFISSDKNLTKLIPRVPNNFLTKNGYEDNTIPRVCMSTSMHGALKALSSNLEGKELYVYTNDNKVNPYKPSEKEVPDCKLTDEVWIKEPVILKYLYKIKVTSNNKDGEVYTYGNNKATLYGWDYEILNESKDKSTLDKNFKPKAKVPYKIVEYNQTNSLKYFGSKDDYYLKTKTGEIIIDTTNNQVIGFVLVKLNNKNIGPLKVMKEYRGQGFGDLLFKDAVTKYRGKQLGVYKDNEVAKKIYKKYCFKEVEDKGDYIIMTLNGKPLQEASIYESVNDAIKGNIVKPTLPAIHAFERISAPYEYQPVMNKVKILNSSGLEDKEDWSKKESRLKNNFSENSLNNKVYK